MTGSRHGLRVAAHSGGGLFGGTETWTARFVEGLQNRGHDVRVFCRDDAMAEQFAACRVSCSGSPTAAPARMTPSTASRFAISSIRCFVTPTSSGCPSSGMHPASIRVASSRSTMATRQWRRRPTNRCAARLGCGTSLWLAPWGGSWVRSGTTASWKLSPCSRARIACRRAMARPSDGHNPGVSPRPSPRCPHDCGRPACGRGRCRPRPVPPGP